MEAVQKIVHIETCTAQSQNKNHENKIGNSVKLHQIIKYVESIKRYTFHHIQKKSHTHNIINTFGFNLGLNFYQ